MIVVDVEPDLDTPPPADAPVVLSRFSEARGALARSSYEAFDDEEAKRFIAEMSEQLHSILRCPEEEHVGSCASLKRDMTDLVEFVVLTIQQGRAHLLAEDLEFVLAGKSPRFADWVCERLEKHSPFPAFATEALGHARATEAAVSPLRPGASRAPFHSPASNVDPQLPRPQQPPPPPGPPPQRGGTASAGHASCASHDSACTLARQKAAPWSDTSLQQVVPPVDIPAKAAPKGAFGRQACFKEPPPPPPKSLPPQPMPPQIELPKASSPTVSSTSNCVATVGTTAAAASMLALPAAPPAEAVPEPIFRGRCRYRSRSRRCRHDRHCDEDKDTRFRNISKALSAILRHGNSTCDVRMTKDGFAPVHRVLRAIRQRDCTAEELRHVVSWSQDIHGTARFVLFDGFPGDEGPWIRAVRKHTIPGVEVDTRR
mmetsp:Transcript_31844/g.87995  ORF Transcript_31844/g.87995 Transcript_31844/m.87995 type:complete len:429 (+) Transcript_31844:81-1367(+)